MVEPISGQGLILHRLKIGVNERGPRDAGLFFCEASDGAERPAARGEPRLCLAHEALNLIQRGAHQQAVSALELGEHQVVAASRGGGRHVSALHA